MPNWYLLSRINELEIGSPKIQRTMPKPHQKKVFMKYPTN